MALPPEEAQLLASAAREPTNAGPYLQLAEEYSAEARPASAFWAYQAASERTPKDASIRLQLAASMLRLGQVQEAEAATRAVLASHGDGASQARLDLADLQLSTGRPTEAQPTP